MYGFSFIVGNIIPKKCKVYPLNYYVGFRGLRVLRSVGV